MKQMMKKTGYDKRKQQRETLSQTVEFSVIDTGGQSDLWASSEKMIGTIIDMSEDGLGLLTEIAIKPGCRIQLLKREQPVLGLVMWTMDHQNQTRAGVLFEYNHSKK